MDVTLRFQSYFLRRNRNLVSIDDLTDHLSTFQKIIYLIAEEKKPTINKYDFRFLVKDIKKGSINCVIEPYYVSKDITGINPVDEVIDDFVGISRLIDEEGDEKTYQQLKKTIKNRERRRTLYGHFERIIPKENKAFQIYIGEPETPEATKIFISRERYKKRIKIWRKMDIKPREKTFIGIIKNLNAYNESRKYFKIVGPNGEKIRYFYKDDEEEKFINLYDSGIIKVKGIYNFHTKTIDNMIDFNEIKSETIKKIKDIEFAHPIDIKLNYKFGVIYGTNEEFDLYAIGSNYNEMLENLYNRINDTIDMFLNPQLQFTNSSEEYRKAFLKTFTRKKSVKL